MNDCSICKNYEPVTAKTLGQTQGGRGMTNKWVYCEEWWEGLTKFVTHHCPYCDCEVSNRKNDDLPDYCPNCGAKMEGEE